MNDTVSILFSAFMCCCPVNEKDVLLRTKIILVSILGFDSLRGGRWWRCLPADSAGVASNPRFRCNYANCSSITLILWFRLTMKNLRKTICMCFIYWFWLTAIIGWWFRWWFSWNRPLKKRKLWSITRVTASCVLFIDLLSCKFSFVLCSIFVTSLQALRGVLEILMMRKMIFLASKRCSIESSLQNSRHLILLLNT